MKPHIWKNTIRKDYCQDRRVVGCQRWNWLVEAGAAVVVDDVPDAKERAQWLWEELEELMNDGKKRDEIKKNCEAIANKEAAA